MLGKNGNWGGTDGNDIPRRTAFKWNKSYEEKGMATWYSHVSAAWNNDNLKVNDEISLAAQIGDSSSLFNYYKTMIKLKQSNPALALGSYANVINDNSKVFSFLRTYNQHKVLVLVNLSNELQTANFEKISTKGAPLFGKAKFNQNQVALNPYEVVVVEMK